MFLFRCIHLVVFRMNFIHKWLFLPIIERAGTAFHSSQNVINEDVTRIIPGINTVVK